MESLVPASQEIGELGFDKQPTKEPNTKVGGKTRVNKISDFDIQFQARCHRPKEANDQMVKETTSPQRHGPPVTRPKRMEMQARKSAVALPLFRFLHHVHCAKLAMWSHPHPPSQLILNDLISCAPFVLPLVFPSHATFVSMSDITTTAPPEVPTSASPSLSSLASSTLTSAAAAATTTTIEEGPGSAQEATGISLVAFVTALAASLVVFGIQTGFFLLLRNKLVRIFKPKTYLVPERERTDSPPSNHLALAYKLMSFEDREIIKKCGLDAYFFLRYLQTLLIIFIPIAVVVIPVLVPLNYIGGLGRDVVNSTTTEDNSTTANVPTGLDTLAWGNVAPNKQHRRWAHLALALAVILWVCGVFFSELKVYIKIRQDYLTSAEHRLRASANTVLVSSIPDKWLSEEALRGLFDVFPGGIRNVWLTRDFTPLLAKVHERDAIHKKLESAASELIRSAKRAQLRKEGENGIMQRIKAVTTEGRADRAQRAKAEDEEARRRAEGAGGLSANTPHIPQGVHEAIDDTDSRSDSGTDIQEGEMEEEVEQEKRRGRGNPLAKIGQGIGKGAGKGAAIATGAGLGLLGGAKAVRKGVDRELERTAGFDFAATGGPRGPPSMTTVDPDSPKRDYGAGDDEERPKMSFASEAPLTKTTRHAHTSSDASQDVSDLKKEAPEPRSFGNTVRRATNMEEMIVTDKTRWYEFWKPPTGSYASPIPQGCESGEYPWKKKKSFWGLVRDAIPFVGTHVPPVDYPPAYTRDYTTHPEEDAEWRKWLEPKERPHHRIANFSWTPSWLPALPLINKKVDTIYWCRAELARLNLEIEEDQQRPERYPVMNSAFIQFNHQVAAHMACQSVTHHVPKQMAPRMVEISPGDVLWDNMAISWWSEWVRSAIVFALVSAMVVLWAFPVAWTASLSQIDALVRKYSWLEFLVENEVINNAIKAVAGVLPALVLMVDNTARAKWTRNTQLPTVSWGSFFPVYTNFACIALIYSIVAPLISLFAIITFSLLWVAHRYNMLYVTRFKTDTGGVLYPRAINQTFTGLYVMELCLIGLFFIAEDETGKNVCFPQGIIMVVALILTILFQYVLNSSFGPLFRYLPITFEDEAVLRDEAFQRAQARRLGLVGDDDDEAGSLNRPGTADTDGRHAADDIELEKFAAGRGHSTNPRHHARSGSVLGRLNPLNKGIAHASTWAARGGKQIRAATFGKAEEGLRSAAQYRKTRRQRDLEAQRAMGDALYGGYCDVIEDLTPRERDVLVRKAFQHSALRARRPVVWIPRDDVGVSDDEIRRTNDFSEYISITNEGTALDSRVRVLYGRNPPDFSEVDLINL
ncbi:hypothetical protein CHGG_04663 [Chaetomium globosum CBS 148.51]|uniref:CSC1/OSCA1-like 7TM region domain-containing protein n=1 Tax=Chaetomium globosum (strain ATCC 6205 / CBS 148.51 / DSM 1962 / NBRC 6347 / NRRL 1970) TaxID=306901 RepID=Q2H0N3_CHAGB|nr:uncharacterized protein CHGG_04663 [Chaetomium globosum CBS 148.51]EAQ88044.1 hypothetical protein CHGG_04663 [Chaetomium globosum CBS 148.51]